MLFRLLTKNIVACRWVIFFQQILSTFLFGKFLEECVFF
jgi:hypothetical protein